MTGEPLDDLEQRRAELYAQLAGTGDFRPGSVNETWRRCGKPACACAQPGNPGHGPRYLWTRSAGGRTRTRQLAAAELDKARREVAAYKQFVAVSEQIVQVNEAICEARPVAGLRCRDGGRRGRDPRRDAEAGRRHAGETAGRRPWLPRPPH
jgi:hypothetical protein